MDYSKWDHIEVSDDEDDTHPNIDTASLFRWRHDARINRDMEWKQEKEKFMKERTQHISDLQKARNAYNEAHQSHASNVADLLAKLQELEEKDKEWQQREKEINKKEKHRPLNVDTISQEGRSRTVINKSAIKEKHIPTEDDDDELHEEAADRLKTFVQNHETEIKKFGMFRRPADSQQYLLANTHLVCNETANHLVLWCLDLAMEEKFGLLDHVSHQCIVMQFMLELAKSLKCDPRSCIRPFFGKFINPEPEYQKMFDEELEAFRKRIRDRAKVKVAEAIAQLEAEEREKRLGPGGLDPLEVLETLPEELRKCFESRDVEMLKTTLSTMDPKDAETYLKKCVDSGLWVENAGEPGALTDGDRESPPEEERTKPVESLEEAAGEEDVVSSKTPAAP